VAEEKTGLLSPNSTPDVAEMPAPEVLFEDWGLIPFAEAWEKQLNYVRKHTEPKLHSRLHGLPFTPATNHLVFCQHPHVYTLGKSGSESNLLISEEERKRLEIEYFHIERGGDITYHGPGQLVGYPLFDLEQFKPDLHVYLRNLELSIIDMLTHFGIVATVYPGLTGVWIEPETPQARKIAAIGIKCSRWVTMHGFALNIDTDLSFFQHIVPCGIQDKAVTSIRAELKDSGPTFSEVSEVLKSKLQSRFGFRFV